MFQNISDVKCQSQSENANKEFINTFVTAVCCPEEKQEFKLKQLLIICGPYWTLKMSEE